MKARRPDDMASNEKQIKTGGILSKHGCLNVAVTGKSGAGKSSFINAIRGLKLGQQGAANTDVKECTKDIQSYQIQDNAHIVFWDLPGLGTETFKQENYIDQVNLFEYDFFLIVGSERLTENDIWLAKTVQNHKKKFYYVRTKVHIDIITEVWSRLTPRSKDHILTTIKNNCHVNLRQHGVSEDDIYLIDNFMPEQYDFNRLRTKLLEDALQFKKTYITSEYEQKETLIRHRKKVLLERIKKAAMEAAVTSSMPVPELGASLNIAVLLRETKHLTEQFELTVEAVAESEDLNSSHSAELQELVERNSINIVCSQKGILDVCKDIELCEIVDLQCAMRQRRSEDSDSWSYRIASKYLNGTLDILYENAVKVNKEIFSFQCKILY